MDRGWLRELEKPVTALRGVRAVIVGLTLKSINDPGEGFGTESMVLIAFSCIAETALNRFDPV